MSDVHSYLIVIFSIIDIDQHMVKNSYLYMIIWMDTMCKISNYSICKKYIEVTLEQKRRKGLLWCVTKYITTCHILNFCILISLVWNDLPQFCCLRKSTWSFKASFTCHLPHWITEVTSSLKVKLTHSYNCVPSE